MNRLIKHNNLKDNHLIHKLVFNQGNNIDTLKTRSGNRSRHYHNKYYISNNRNRVHHRNHSNNFKDMPHYQRSIVKMSRGKKIEV